MSLFSDVADAWLTDLRNVTGLDTTTVPASSTHLYAPWSTETLFSEAGERHLAIWPQSEAETATPYTTDLSQLATQDWVVMVWEAAPDQTRLQDDDTDNKAWLTLAEGIRTRLMLRANVQLGSSTIMDTRYTGLAFERAGSHRVMALRFSVRVPLTAG